MAVAGEAQARRAATPRRSRRARPGRGTGRPIQGRGISRRFLVGSACLGRSSTLLLGRFRYALGGVKQVAGFDPEGFGEVDDFEVGNPTDLGFDLRVSPSAQVPALQVESCHEHRLR